MPPKELSDENARKEKILNIIEREFDLELLLKYRELRVLEHEIERGRELKELLEKLILNEHIYADRSSGRLSAPPQFNLVASHNADIFLNSTGEDALLNNRARGGGLSRNSPSIIPQKPVSAAQQYQYDVRPDGVILRMRCPSCGAEKFRSMLGFLNHCRINCKLSFLNQEERLQRCGIQIPFEEIPPEFKNLSHSLMQKSMELAQICAEVSPTKIVEDVKPEIRENLGEPLDLKEFGLSGVETDLSAKELKPAENNRHFNTSAGDRSNTSRYYIKKQIIIGNVSRCLLQSGEVDTSVSGKPATHFFKLYIREADFRKKRKYDGVESSNDVLRHVKFVRFILHPAYKPNEIIDVYERPFTIEKPSWGEFPVRIQLHFFDEKNKPVDLVHLLSIFGSTSSRYDQGVERIHEVEIDKNTDFALSSQPIQKPTIEEDVLDSDSDDSENEANSQSSSPDQTSNNAIESQNEAEIDPNSLKYCRYCGVPHMPQSSFEIIQKNCAHKPRKVRLNSRTLPNAIFANCVMDKQEVEVAPPSSLTFSSEQNSFDDHFVDSSSPDEVKMVAAAVSALGLPKFSPTESVSFMMAAALKCFLKGLLKKSIDKIPAPETRAALDQQLPATLSPLHIFQAVSGDSSSDPDAKDKDFDKISVYDFISNAYFSASLGNAKLPPQ